MGSEEACFIFRVSENRALRRQLDLRCRNSGRLEKTA
jgi:hypothetical protein